jgi:uncharacterized protein YdaL
MNLRRSLPSRPTRSGRANPVPSRPMPSGRANPVLRRCVTGLIATAVLATGGTLANIVAADAGQIPARPAGHGAHDAEAPGETNGAPIPAPPRPSSLRPLQRLLTTSTAASAPATATAAAAVPAGASGKAAPGGGTARTLVLYDSTGQWGWLGEVYGEQTANLVSHYGAWSAHPVSTYQPGELANYSAVVYLGSTYDEPIPVSFLDDVLGTTKQVVWMYDNIWQLTARKADFAAAYGFQWKQFDTASVSEVRYRGTSLTRDPINAGGIMDHVITDPTKAVSVGEAVRPDGTTFPWAVRSANLTYVGEIPFSYVTHDDRYLAFADLLTETLAPQTLAGPVATRHRALVRIEDVGPDADPAELKAVADYLYSKKVPFTVAVYPRYKDPKGVDNNGKPQEYGLAQKPQVVSALKYLTTHGGTLLMHGWTHQYGTVANPYDGVSANDFEFYRAHVDAANSVIYDGPVAGDSQTWATGRMLAARLEFAAAGLAQPTIFEFPHYAGSVADYTAAQAQFGVRYDRGLYFPGVFSGAAVDYSHLSGQFFPYTVRDVYGSAVLPENLGNVEPEPFNNHPARLPADLIASAKRNLVVRDGTASFFYHPYLGTAYLKTVVEGVQGLGYQFVPASAMLAG